MNKRKRGLIFEYYIPIHEKERQELIAACPVDVQFLLLEYTLIAHLKNKRLYRILQVIQEFKTIHLIKPTARFTRVINTLYGLLAKYVSRNPCILRKDVDGHQWFKAFRALYKHIYKQYCIFKLANKYHFLVQSLLSFLLNEESPKPTETHIYAGTYIDYTYDNMMRFRIMKMPKKDGKYALMKYCLPHQMAILVDHKEYFQFIYLIDSSIKN
jgi:hypothetical protein